MLRKSLKRHGGQLRIGSKEKGTPRSAPAHATQSVTQPSFDFLAHDSVAGFFLDHKAIGKLLTVIGTPTQAHRGVKNAKAFLIPQRIPTLKFLGF